jgi:hypothetical protein
LGNGAARCPSSAAAGQHQKWNCDLLVVRGGPKSLPFLSSATTSGSHSIGCFICVYFGSNSELERVRPWRAAQQLHDGEVVGSILTRADLGELEQLGRVREYGYLHASVHGEQLDGFTTARSSCSLQVEQDGLHARNLGSANIVILGAIRGSGDGVGLHARNLGIVVFSVRVKRRCPPQEC